MSSGRLFLLFALWAFVYCQGYSQQGTSSIHFEKPGHNFGTVREDGGVLQHDFAFTNRGVGALVVTDVRVSGGVTVTGWTRNPVMQGESGLISLEYDPENKPGKFNRRIVLTSNGNPASTELRLLGDVLPRERSPADMFPREIGSLRLKSNHISFGRIYRGTVRTDSMQVLNLSGEALDLSFTHIPAHVSVKAVPSMLENGQEGFIIVSYDADMADEWGTSTHNFRLMINGNSPARNMVYVSANIQEDFSSLNDEGREKAPVITFDNRVFDFGRIGQGESIEHQFIFSNEGQSELIIRAIRAGCGCTATEPQKSVLGPGESSSIKTVFSSGGFRGRQNKAITVISNDPANPSVVLRVTGEVIAE